MNSEDDDAESEPARRPRRVVRELPAEQDTGRTDRLLYRIEGELDVPAFLTAVADVIERHDAWGLAAPEEGAGGAAPGRSRRGAFSDLVAYQRVDMMSEDEFTRCVSTLAARDVDSFRSRRVGYPLRMRLLEHSPDVYVFSIACQGVSENANVRTAFEEELWQLYETHVVGPARLFTADAYAQTPRRERFAALPAEPVPAPAHRAGGGSASTLEVRFRFSGEPLRRMREAALRNGTNEFVWTQCALASAVFEYCPADAIALWVSADSILVGGHAAQDAAGVSLPLVVERAESPEQLLRAVTREWLSKLRVRGAERELEPGRGRGGEDREPPRPGPSGALRVAYINHVQEQMNRTAGRSAAHPGAAALAVKRETTGVHMLVQSWAEHVGVTLTFNTSWIAQGSAGLLAGSVESALQSWTELPCDASRTPCQGRAARGVSGPARLR
ncbi:hypothetical protein [Actinospica robiniae]|uniref:hypothetical protein n=1 Tax=Actinospica robiniae TaxID=304901 RepID=UPI00040D4FAC|nr:hypothetical protein [Actinospica robiniae]